MINFKVLKRCYRVNNYSDFLKKKIGDLFTLDNRTFCVKRVTWKGIHCKDTDSKRGMLLLPTL